MTCLRCPYNRTAFIMLDGKPSCRTCQREVLDSKRDVKIAPLPPMPRNRIALEVRP